MNVCNMMYSLWNNKIKKKKKRFISYSKISTATANIVLHSWGGLPLVPVFGTIFQNIQKFGSFCVFHRIFRLAFKTNIAI